MLKYLILPNQKVMKHYRPSNVHYDEGVIHPIIHCMTAMETSSQHLSHRQDKMLECSTIQKQYSSYMPRLE